MVVFQGLSDTKYQLLENPRRRCVFVAHSWAIFGFVVLSVCITLISLIVIWNEIKQMQQKTETLDFVLFGPKREISDIIRFSEYRVLTYALANDTRNDDNNGLSAAFVTNESAETYQHVTKNYSLVCYYVIPARSSTTSKLLPQGIDPLLCTHIIIFFATLKDSSIHFPESKVVNDVVKMKQKNSYLKVMLSIVSFSASEDEFSRMVSSAKKRKRFINNAQLLLKQYLLDGIDLDWEFPAWPPNHNVSQKDQFTSLLQEMRTTFGNKYLISVAVAAPFTIINRSYDVPKIAQYVDFVNIMCYDYHAFVWYLPFTGPNAPLFADASDLGYAKTLNTNYSVNVWIQNGMPRKKIMVGLPIYGHSWTLDDPTKHDFGAPADGFGGIGEKGFISYRDVCKFLNSSGVTQNFNGDMRVPYAYKEKEWFSFEDERSLSYKAEYITEMGLGGAMIFNLNEDDSNGSNCPSAIPFPLVKRVRTVLLDDRM